jgi:hypothetical protein
VTLTSFFAVRWSHQVCRLCQKWADLNSFGLIMKPAFRSICVFLVASTPLSWFWIWLPQTLALTRNKRERREGMDGQGRWVRTYEAQSFLQHNVQSYQTCRSDWGLKLANNGQEQFLDVLWSRFAQVLLNHEAPVPLSVVLLLVASAPLGCSCIWLPQTLAWTGEKNGKGQGIDYRGNRAMN